MRASLLGLPKSIYYSLNSDFLVSFFLSFFFVPVFVFPSFFSSRGAVTEICASLIYRRPKSSSG